MMALANILIESHSYSGGLRYTAFDDGPRPAWVPPADSVGWRDDFVIDGDDAVIEYNQRSHDGAAVGWIAVYRRSTDAQLGDRSNHAGFGVWLRGQRIADARSLLLALHQYTTALARNPDPLALADDIAKFASDRFLGAYLLAADSLPRDWSGAPASASSLALVDTQYDIVHAPSFAEAVDRAADRITWLSLGWKTLAAPRTIILATARPPVSLEREMKELDPPGGVLAEVIQRLPDAFAEERRIIGESTADLASKMAAWEERKAADLQQIASERREARTLDGLPPTLEGIAVRLNDLSRQLADVHTTVKPIVTRAAGESAARVSVQPAQQADIALPVQKARPTPQTSHRDDRSLPSWLIALIIILVAGLIGAICYLIYTSM